MREAEKQGRRKCRERDGGAAEGEGKTEEKVEKESGDRQKEG